MGLLQRAWVENTVREVETHWLSGGKKKLSVKQSVKKEMLTVF